jgi:hypothetical protein
MNPHKWGVIGPIALGKNKWIVLVLTLFAAFFLGFAIGKRQAWTFGALVLMAIAVFLYWLACH